MLSITDSPSGFMNFMILFCLTLFFFFFKKKRKKVNRQNKRRHADNCQILLAVFRERAGGVALLGLWIARLHTHQWYICFGIN